MHELTGKILIDRIFKNETLLNRKDIDSFLKRMIRGNCERTAKITDKLMIILGKC